MATTTRTLDSLIDEAIETLPRWQRFVAKRRLRRFGRRQALREELAFAMSADQRFGELIANPQVFGTEAVSGDTPIEFDPANLRAILDLILEYLPLILQLFLVVQWLLPLAFVCALSSSTQAGPPQLIADVPILIETAEAGDPTKSQSVSTAAVAAEAAPSAPAKTRAAVGTTRIFQTRTSSHPAAARLKTTSELRSEIARNRTSRTYATISPATLSWAQRHLQDHGYTSSQVAGLSYSDAWMLHNIAHSTNKISPYRRGPMPMPVRSFQSGCPGGQCPTAAPASSRRQPWRPGRVLFGR